MHYEQVPFPLLFSASRGFVGPAPLGGSCPEVPSLEGPRTDGVPLAVRARYRCQDVFVLQTVPADSLRGTPRLHRSRTRYQMLQMRTIQRGSRQHHAMHQLHRPHAFEGMSTVGRVVHQIRQRRIDSTRLRADMCGKGGLEHEDVLLPAGRLQFRTFVDVQQHSRHPRCLDGGSPRRTNSSWLIRR